MATVAAPKKRGRSGGATITAPKQRQKAVARALEPAAKVESAAKYVVRRSDGAPPDPAARYLVLRLDTDPFARKAAQAYAEIVKSANPGLADAVRKAAAATRKPGWRLPHAPSCTCGSGCRPIALEDFGRWSLEWECLACCDPVAGPAIAWPFAEPFAEGSDFERIGIDWDYA